MLKDVLTNGLNVVFCGTAKGETSARRGFYYAGLGNQFYPILFAAGFTPKLLRPEDCYALNTYGIGLTDLVSTKSGKDSVLDHDDFDVESVLKKIRKYQPRFLAFNGKLSASYVLGLKGKTGGVRYGLNEMTIGSTQVFVLPSTSGSARSSWDAAYCHELNDLLKSGKKTQQKQAEITAAKANKPISSIVLPDLGNSITESDIKSGMLRITVAFKAFFKEVRSNCIIHYKGKTATASYTPRVGHSDVFRIGGDAMRTLNVRPNSRVRITKLSNGHFELALA